MQPRWDGDERGSGVADGSRLVGGIQELGELARAERWVTEAPETHLLPHLRRACAEAGSMFAYESGETASDGAFIIRLRRKDESAGVGQVRAAIFSLIGTVAETSTYIRQRRELTVEVLTGILAHEGPFGTHGHLLVLRVV